MALVEQISNYKNQLAKYNKSLEEIKNKKIVEQTNLQHLINKEKEVIAAIKSKGIDPSKLTEYINSSMAELDDVMKKLAMIIPADGSIPNNVEEILSTIKTKAEPVDDIDLDNIKL